MLIEQLTRDNLDDYLHLLTPDEIFGTIMERYISFGAYDENTQETLGTITVEILPEYIGIRRIFTDPYHRNKGVATGLLEFIKDVPDNLALPLCAITDEDVDFLLKRGFKSEKSSYTFAEGNLGNFDRPPVDEKVRKSHMVKNLDNVDTEMLEDFVEGAPHDEFIQFPDMCVDNRRFSDGSLVSMSDGEVTGAVLMEEPGDDIRITWAYAKSEDILMLLLSVLKTELDMEYENRKQLRFLLCDRRITNTVGKIFHKSEIRPVVVMKSGIGG